MLKRAATQKLWASHWHCCAGKIEEGETLKEAIIRETFEEMGIQLSNVQLVTTISLTERSQLEPGKLFYAVELFFLAHLDNSQAPINKEPTKQADMQWFPLNDLPKDIVPGVRFGIDCYLNHYAYGEYKNESST